MGLEWVVTPTDAWMVGYQRWVGQIIRAVEDVLKAREDEITQWLKDNHIWNNRTGLAEQGLNTKVFRDGLFVYVLMYYSENTFYSKYLELYMRGPGSPSRFSLLGPALDYWAPLLLEDIKAIVE